MEFDEFQHHGRFFSALARDLKSLALSNVQFFKDGKQSYHAKFHVSFCLLYDYLDLGIEPSFRELSSHVHLFDYSPNVKGNGYRSILHVVQKCCLHLLQLVRYISSMRDSMLFRRKFYSQELEAYVSALGQLRAVLYYSLKLLNYCEEGDLFTNSEVINDEVARSLMLEIEDLNQESFYGRCIGFQYCSSMLRPLQALGIAMASYSEGYLESSSVMQMATSVFNSGKYFLDPELRAEQIVKATRTSDIRFCKALWGLSETGLMKQLPAFVCPAVEVDELFPLGPDAFEMPLEDGSDTVVITPPCAHTGPGHVYVRLISAHLRDGQESIKKAPKSKSPPLSKPRTPGLVVHIHGGGFVAHSSQSHEVYLRDWAHVFNVPIVSIDYSLSPEMPFPRALEECFYAYAWVVKNCELLGSTGKSIVIVGDSAGGNLAISTAMRAASFGIRCPEGVVPIYACTLVSYTPSPARLLSLMDPLLSFGLLSRCLAAYAGVNEEHPLATPQNEELHSEASLSSLQVKSMEASNQDWIIIAQNEQECKDIDEKLAASSPVVEQRERSVMDSLEDSFHGDMEDSKGSLERSDTGDSEEVEIFSQLAAAGSCVLQNETRKLRPRSDKDGNSHAENTLDAKDSGPVGSGNSVEEGMSGAKPKDGKGITTLEGIQETAKSMVAGAQSMFTSLSSYIPKRSKVDGFEASMSATHDLPMVTTPDIDCFVDLSYSSDPVDGSRGPSPSSPEPSESCVQGAAPPGSDSFHNVSEMKSESCVSVIGFDECDPAGNVHVDRGLLESEATEEDAKFSPSTFIGDVNASEQNAVRESGTFKADAERKESDLSTSNSLSSFKESKVYSETADSSLFKSALTSPVPEVTGQAMTLSYLDSPSVTNSHVVPIFGTSRPTLGMSPNVESAFHTSIPTSSTQGMPSSLSSDANSDTRVTSLDCPTMPSQNSSVPHAKKLDPGDVELTVHQSSSLPPPISSQTLSPGNPPSFAQDDFACDPNSLCQMPSLPQERKDLLEDAIQTADFWGDDSVGCSNSEKRQVLSHQKTSGKESHDKKTGLATAASDGTERASSEDTSVKEVEKSWTHDGAEDDDSEETAGESLESARRGGDDDLKSRSVQSAGPSRLPARPPSELKLARTTSDAPPDRFQTNADCGLSSESMEGDQDGPDFDKSCLEFLTPSSTVNDNYPGGHVGDGIFRSESAPALSSFLTPSPDDGARLPSVSRQPGLNGLRMGMSPSDFKRRTFATQSPLNTMKKVTVVKNPYMSPVLATEELLRGLPPVTLVACNLDPLLDDSIMFAKRLKSYDMPVSLHLVDDLPHGFLNFALLSTEAKKASRFCAQKVVDFLEKDV